VGVARKVGEYLLGSGERALGIDVPVGIVERLEPSLEATLSARSACGPKNCRRPSACAAFSIASILPRNILR